MKLRNKKTGEVKDTKELITVDWFKKDWQYLYTKLKWLMDEWEDYEKVGYWYYDTVDNNLVFTELSYLTEKDKKLDEQIGNQFETKEEAEKAVEKLKAWKRLKDKGFRFTGWSPIDGISFKTSDEFYDSNDLIPAHLRDDLDLLFGGEE